MRRRQAAEDRAARRGKRTKEEKDKALKALVLGYQARDAPGAGRGARVLGDEEAERERRVEDAHGPGSGLWNCGGSFLFPIY